MKLNSNLLKSKLLFFLSIFITTTFSLFAQQSATAPKAMVVAPTPEAVDAGLSILKQGGNAIDAAAAMAFSLMVTDPAMCSVGGRSQILIYLKDGQAIGIDGATQSPRLVEEPAFIGHGYRTCPIPGSPATLEQIVRKYGTLAFRKILEPAIQLAKEGFIIKKDYHELFHKYGTLFHFCSGTAKHFLKPDGTFYSEGERFVQPALARTLEIIADEGAGTLYRGKLAEAIIKDMQNNHGLVTAEDLAQYRPRKGEIVSGNYRGYKIISRGDQCDGASVIEVLQILEHFNLSDYQVDDPKYLHILAQAMTIGKLDEHLPDWQQTSEALAARRVREIDLNRALPVPIKPEAPEEEGYTNHLSVIDEQGNAVSLTQSIGPTFGSKVVNPELGFFYAYSYDMNSDPIPYQREKTSQSPTIILKDERPFIVLGSAGSSRIPASIVQTIINVIDHKMTLYRAVASPRIFLYENELRIENRNISNTMLEKLQSFGYRIKTYDQLNGWFGRIHAILIDESTQNLYGAADPRDFGEAKGY
jgi:gamma-glutamyltranspeptidase/glutathione hydrolase